MAWIYLAESEASAKPWLHGCGLSPTVSESDTLKPSCFQEWSAEKSTVPQFGMTSQPCEAICSQESTSSQVGSPAKTSHLLEIEQAWQESEAAYFSKSLGLFASFDPASSSWKMCQESLPGMPLEPSTESWPRWGMIVGGECFQLTMWERRTKGNAGFVWPTPAATPGTSDLNWEATDGRTKPNKLGWAVGITLGTPTARMTERSKRFKSKSLTPLEFVRMWPTPRTGGLCGGTGHFEMMMELENNGQITTEERKGMTAGNGGSLNPLWVEWLMGYPIESTGLSASAMAWFRSKSKKRSKGLRGSNRTPKSPAPACPDCNAGEGTR